MADKNIVQLIMKFFCHLLMVLIVIDEIQCDRVLQKMYEPIQGNLACFKRFNGTHEIGCGSDFQGNVGVLHLIDSNESFEWFLQKGPHAYYVLVLLPEYFTSEILDAAWKSGKLTGALLINPKNISTPANFSGEHSCPNRESDLYKDTSYSSYCSSNPWNPHGTSLLYMNWQFPIFYIEAEKSIENILKCYNTFNKPLDDGEPRDWPLCAVQLKSNMFGTTNTEVCFRRSQSLFSMFDSSFCEPLEDINIWNSIIPLNNTKPIEEKSVIIVATSADASSMFDNVSPGAESAITGLVTLLATAEALGKAEYTDDLLTASKNIIFVVYEGESWDYIGSSRMVYDMSNNEFPYKPITDQADQMAQLNLTHIDAVIDLKQLGLSNDGGERRLYFHTDPISNKNFDISERNDQFFKTFQNEAQHFRLNIKKSADNSPLPPSSFQSFLKKQNMSGFVLTDHEGQYKNMYYDSIFDDINNVNYKTNENDELDENDKLHKDITDIASTLASSLFNLVTENNLRVKANPNTVNNLLYCYLKNTNCTYFRDHSDSRLILTLKPEPAKMYVSVQRSEHHLSYMTAKLLSYFIGSTVELNETMCLTNSTQVSALEYFPFIDNGTCIMSAMHTSSALSPAFVIKDYDWKSGEYSSWTESVWQGMEARLFLKPSQSQEISLLIGGIISVILSVTIIYFLNSRAELIFLSEISPTQC